MLIELDGFRFKELKMEKNFQQTGVESFVARLAFSKDKRTEEQTSHIVVFCRFLDTRPEVAHVEGIWIF